MKLCSCWRPSHSVRLPLKLSWVSSNKSPFNIQRAYEWNHIDNLSSVFGRLISGSCERFRDSLHGDTLCLYGCSSWAMTALTWRIPSWRARRSSLWSHLGVGEIEAEALADGDDNQTTRSLIFRQIKRQGKAASGTAGLLWKDEGIINY